MKHYEEVIKELEYRGVEFEEEDSISVKIYDEYGGAYKLVFDSAGNVFELIAGQISINVDDVNVRGGAPSNLSFCICEFYLKEREVAGLMTRFNK